VVLIAEGLARAFMCGRMSCPTREAWCPNIRNSGRGVRLPTNAWPTSGRNRS
jgi:hypothetical protein